MSRPAQYANLTYRVAIAIGRALLALTTKRNWRGQEHLPSTGGFLAAGNHMSPFDPLPFALFIIHHGHPLRMLAKAPLFKVPVLGWILRKTGQIPVFRQTATAGESLNFAVEQLTAGECVAVFPEGTLTREPHLWPMAGKTGVARLALTAKVPVVPIAQWGSDAILPRYTKRFRPFPRKPVWVHAGPPVDLSDLYDRPQDTLVLREATERIMAAITGLLEDIRGEQAPEVRYDMHKAVNETQEDSSIALIGPHRGSSASDQHVRAAEPTVEDQQPPQAGTDEEKS